MMDSNPMGVGTRTCKECEYEWFYKPTKLKKPYYIQCPQCRQYERIRERVLD